MRLGKDVVRTVDLPDTPEPPAPALDPRVEQELAAVRQDVAKLTARLDRLENPAPVPPPPPAPPDA